MQQKFANYKICNAEEINALRKERKVKEKDWRWEASQRKESVTRGMAANETKEKSEYNPTPRTKGVTNNSSTSKSRRRHPFIDGITT